MELVRWGIVFIITALNSVSDILNKTVSGWLVLGASAAVAVCAVFDLEYGGTELLYGAAVGCAALALAWSTKEAIGYGDGLVLMMMGIGIGIYKTIFVCAVAVCAAGILAVILLVFFHRKKNYEIPFIPFLLLGLITERVMECV